MTTWDSFMLNDELDMLECRLYEMEPHPVTHVVVEADVDHQGHPKPYHLSENWERFSPWHDRLKVVRASGLPESPNPWVREHAQREHVWAGLEADPDDVILHGDVDEIPSGVLAPDEWMVYAQAGHYLAVDWLHPDPWLGTVVGRVGWVESFAQMRHRRYTASCISGGWHLSWLGGWERVEKKVGSFCHLEFLPKIPEWISQDSPGLHLDGKQMSRSEGPWPRWVEERKCPAEWFC